jgi:hypothetical protein
MQPERPHEVGYQKPPQHSRFKPGQSGNPHARQKAGRDFAKLFSQALDQTITVTEDGRRRKITKREVLVRQLVDRAAQGNPKALSRFFRLMNEVDRGKQRHPPRITKVITIHDDPKPPS